MGLSENAIFNLSRSFCRYGLVNESRRFSRVLSINYYSEEKKPREASREEDEGEMEERNGKDSTNKENWVDDKDETKKKVVREPGGKPVDEDKDLGVNWRPIVEDKPSSQSSS